VSFTEADCTRNGRFDKDMAVGLAIAEFTEMFGAPLITMATGRKAVWNVELI
jgi:hypothetical protein